MTRDKIIALQPRELDALVAEKVEGLPVVWAPDPHRVPDRRLTDHHPWLNGNANGHEYSWEPVKRYSTDWSIMKRVIEAMKADGWRGGDVMPRARRYVSTLVSIAETASRQICRAACIRRRSSAAHSALRLV